MPVKFNIALANKVVGITACYDSVYRLCRDYLTDMPCDFHVAITDEDIQYERNKAFRESAIGEKKDTDYPDSFLETLAVYRKIASAMLAYDTLLFHGSAIAVDGEAYLFAAKSGTGKSTHARLWRELFGDKAVMVNDDKPLLQIADNRVYVCGTPWDGKHRQSSNAIFPLKAIAVLERDDTNHISRIDKKTALPMLLQQSFRPGETEKLTRVLALIDRIGDYTALYQLGCNEQPDAATVSYYGMNEGDSKL